MMPALSGPALPVFAVGALMLVVTAALLLVNRAARMAYTAPDTIVFARGPSKMIGGAVVVAACAFAAPFVGFDGENVAIWLLFLLAFFAFIWWCQYLGPALVFYVADSVGLTRQWLAVKKTLAWHEIDWVYGAIKRTDYKAYGVVKYAQSTEQTIMVEAGPKRKIKILLKTWLVGGNPEVLLGAIEQRATNAQFGFDKSPLVIARRNAAMGAVSRYR